jgi:hypothetical protein
MNPGDGFNGYIDRWDPSAESDNNGVRFVYICARESVTAIRTRLAHDYSLLIEPTVY